MGKGVGELLTRCEQSDIPCIGLGGLEKLPSAARARFARTYSLSSLANRAETMNRPALWLARAARQAANDWTHRAGQTPPRTPPPSAPDRGSLKC
jgi:hypothetical protein